MKSQISKCGGGGQGRRGKGQKGPKPKCIWAFMVGEGAEGLKDSAHIATSTVGDLPWKQGLGEFGGEGSFGREVTFEECSTIRESCPSPGSGLDEGRKGQG